ncbi:MAG: hypothetical protein WCF94_04035 [bacterium]
MDLNNYQAPVSGITGWIITKGWAKDQKVAELIQVIATIIFFALSFYFFFY